MLVGQQFELSFFALNFNVMMGLAVGIDYVLFILGRYREERTNGLGIDQAIIKAGNTSSKAVLFSGLTVVTALLGMLLVPSNIFQSLGLAAIIVVLVSVVATLTLLPAILKLLGDRVERGRGRALMIVIGLALLLFAAMFQGIGVDLVFSIAYVVLAIGAFVLAALNIDPFHLRQNSTRDGFWDRMTRFVLARPLPLFAATTAVLIAITSIYFTINTGQSGISTMPRDTSAYRAFTILGQQFSGISLEEPHEIVIDTPDANTPEVQAAIASLTGQLGNDADFGQTTVRVNEAGDLAAISVAATGDTQSAAALESIDRLRDEYIPAAFAGVNAEVLVTGPTAFTVDFNAVVAEYTPIVFTFVLGISILVLLLAFRSIVVPIKSVIMNLLSVGASYGLLVAVFQHGWGNELLGFRQVEQIDAWVPLMMFTVLFGLSMDYQVFLLSRIKERYDLTRDNTDAVSYGLRSTASIITGAALIMVAVFGGFAMGELSMFQQMGFGLATAVILDATIIRSVLVPSGMKLLGDWNWYFPNWLGWLPKINVEGVSEDEPAFAPEATVAD
jgi:RND superfamily putative drug exporter